MTQRSQHEAGAAGTSGVVERNIAALLARRAAEERALGWEERVAETVTRLAGSMRFVWFHAAVFGCWIIWNVMPGLPRFDPTLVILAMAASVEAIFLSTFILITQNRMQAQADRRADLALQINLLSEHEITRLIQMVSEIGERIGSAAAQRPDLHDLKKDVQPEAVLDALERGGQSAARPDEHE
jgi:uncharacterized membrane protein